MLYEPLGKRYGTLRVPKETIRCFTSTKGYSTLRVPKDTESVEVVNLEVVNFEVVNLEVVNLKVVI